MKVKLSKPSKMPCFSWSIRAIHCLTGSKLAKIEGSTCAKCYAKRGNYLYPNVQQSLDERLSQFNEDSDKWIEGMINAIRYNSTTTYFRWFDSGDLQSVKMLDCIVQIAYNMPEFKFWLPTRETDILKAYFKSGKRKPSNLTIRLSDAMIDKAQKLPKILADNGILQSGVSKDKAKVNCASFEQHGKCLACRACWDSKEKITYLQH